MRLETSIMCMMLGGCAGATEPEASLSDGTARFALSLPAAGPILRVEYEITLTFLEVTPPLTYAHQTLPSLAPDGDLLTILPCRTGADGTGLNQVDVVARIWLSPDGAPLSATSSEVFTCRRNADTAVDVLLAIMGALDAGFVDLDVQLTGVLCAGKIDWKPDTWSGVCGESSCGDPRALFLFANTCQTLSGEVPRFWACGAPAEWNLVAGSAYAFFAPPERDGTWRFGVTALDPRAPNAPDDSVVDDSGTRRVFRAVRTRRAELAREDGVTHTDIAEIEHAFAAVLALPPRADLFGAPEVILLVHNDEQGADLSWHARFGSCDMPVEGFDEEAGLVAVDLHLVGRSAVDVYLGAAGSETGPPASHVTRCAARWAGSAPSLDCEEPRALEIGGTP